MKPLAVMTMQELLDTRDVLIKTKKNAKDIAEITLQIKYLLNGGNTNNVYGR